jgi:hypothetical protein
MLRAGQNPATGGPEVLAVSDVPDPVAGDGEEGAQVIPVEHLRPILAPIGAISVLQFCRTIARTRCSRKLQIATK